MPKDETFSGTAQVRSIYPSNHFMFYCHDYCKTSTNTYSTTFYLHDYIPQRIKKTRPNSSFWGYTFRIFKNTRSELEEYLSSAQKPRKTHSTEVCDFTYLLSYVVTCE